MSFISEVLIFRSYRSAMKLVLPNLALFFAAAAIGFSAGKLTETWQVYTLWSLAAAFAFFFWLVPVISYLGNRIELTSSRLVTRAGLFGSKSQELSLAEIANVVLTKRVITVTSKVGSTIELTGYPKPKNLVRQINAHRLAV
jgi:ABC-type dipeptide/oligopeptide/nickel transport system permease subunit